MYDLALIGLGPAGLEAASVAIKNGLKVIAFEKNELGGTCLNIGCIPTKSILYCAHLYNEIKNCNDLGLNIDSPSYNWQQVLNRKTDIVSKFTKTLNTLLAKKMTLIKSEAEIVINDNDIELCADDNYYQAKNIIIASGSKPRELPNLKFDNNFILNSDELFNLKELPKSIAIVGSGAIGLEWAFIMAHFGVEVKLIEKAPCLAPLFDIDIQKRLERILKLNKIEFYKNDFIKEIKGNTIILNSNNTFEVEKVLVAIGREPVLPKVTVAGCKDEFQFKLRENYSTDFDNIFITGDCANGVMLAHSASFQARSVMNKILFNKEIKQKQIPSVIYITPEIASIGLREQDIENKDEYKIKKLPVTSVAKFWCDNAVEGIIKVILKDDKILGAHVVSKDASSIITLFSVFMDKEIPVNEICDMIFPHPSIEEVVLEVLKLD